MARLRLSDKDYIAKNITNDLKKQIEEKREKLEQDLQKIIDSLLPQEISDFKKKHPKWIKRWNICFNDLSNYFKELSKTTFGFKYVVMVI